MFNTSPIHLWLQTTATVGLLIILLAFAGLIPGMPPASPGYDEPDTSLISPTLDFVLGVVMICGISSFAGFFFVFEFIRSLLVRVGRQAGRPAQRTSFLLQLLLHSQVLAFSIPAVIFLLITLKNIGSKLRHFGDVATLDSLLVNAHDDALFALALFAVLSPACLIVWAGNARKLRREWDAGLAH